jgi:hypothetical protein
LGIYLGILGIFHFVYSREFWEFSQFPWKLSVEGVEIFRKISENFGNIPGNFPALRTLAMGLADFSPGVSKRVL